MFTSEQNNFIASSLALRSNVCVKPLAACVATPLDGTTDVVLLGTKKALQNEKFLSQLPSSLQDATAAILFLAQSTSEKSTSTTVVATSPKPTLVTVAVVPEKATRNNAASRPDVVASLVRSSSKSLSAESNGLSVFYAMQNVGSEMCVTAAVARAFTRFTVKKGAAKAEGTSAFLAKVPTTSLTFVDLSGQGTIADAKASALESLSRSIQLAAWLVDAPPNLLNTTTFTTIAQGIGKEVGFDVSVTKGQDLVAKGFTGVYNVGKAAMEPPAFVELTYTGTEPSTPKNVFVGKGIVYDTGGLALKPAAFMCGMKMDMGGAAGVFGAIVCAALTKASTNITTILCLAENAIGPDAYRNDDVILLHSGISAEINNTDAEGRIVLSDGISYASRHLSPATIVDMATLTGAQGIATGLYHAGVYTNSFEWEGTLMKNGLQSGDLCFPLVYCPEFHEVEFASPVADQKNSVANRSNASSSCAGRFLEKSLSDSYDGPWMHIDMAFPAASCGLATGYGVALLASTFFGNVF